MNPNIWGPSFWNTFHYVTFTYPNYPTDYDKKKFIDFIDSFQKNLPCDICRIEFSNILMNNKITNNILKNRKNLVKWGIYIHNIINKKLNKKIYSFNDVIYSHTKKNNDTFYITIIFIIIFILIIKIFFF